MAVYLISNRLNGDLIALTKQMCQDVVVDSRVVCGGCSC